jgi:hypothetical protein
MDTSARLIELDERNVATAMARAREFGLEHVDAVVADATKPASYVGAVPANVVVVCGVFGNVPDSELGSFIGRLPELCAPAATIVWTRHRRAPDMTEPIGEHFRGAGFERVRADRSDAVVVASQKLVRSPRALELDDELFHFVADPAWG